MSLDAPRAGPRHKEPARHDQHPAKSTDPRLASTLARPVDELAARRELRSWIAAAEWLNARGYPAAVPDRLVRSLTARGLTVWSVTQWEAA